MAQNSPPLARELLLRLHEISEHATETAFLTQRLLSESGLSANKSAFRVGDNDLTTLLTLLLLSVFLGSFTILGKTSRLANLGIVNLAAPVCTAITAGVWLIVGRGGSPLGDAHAFITVFLLSFGVVAGLAAVYRRFDGHEVSEERELSSTPNKSMTPRKFTTSKKPLFGKSKPSQEKS